MSKEVNLLDELDKKVLTEFPLIIEVLTTTLKKISTIIESHFIILKNEIEEFIKEKEDWKLSKKECFENYHYPFSEAYEKKISIRELEEYYRIDYKLKAFKGDENKKINYFELWVGFYYSKLDPRPFFFYQLQRDQIEKLGITQIIPHKFFESLSLQYSDKIEVSHPDQDDSSERIEFFNYDICDVALIKEQFEIFKVKILREYLKNIKW